MLKPTYLYRNARAGELLELFMVSAISCLLANRLILELLNYPSIGGKSLHIAHVLWGGALMMAALVLALAFIGNRVQRLSSVVGGIGFGLFIDELGKFITRDNNYFFQPTIALIYLIFVLLFLAFRSLGRRRILTQPEYLLNAVMMIEEVAMNDLDEAERARALEYLAKSDPLHPLVPTLTTLLQTIRPREVEKASIVWRVRHSLEHAYEQFVLHRFGTSVISIVFIIKALVFIGLIGMTVATFFANNDIHQLAYVSMLELVSALTATGFMLMGVRTIRVSRWKAYDFLLKSLLIDIFLTQFFAFYRSQLSALPLFAWDIALYVALKFLVRQERRVQLKQADTPLATEDSTQPTTQSTNV